MVVSIFLLTMGALLSLGVSARYFSKAGSPPKAMAAKVSITKLIHKIWVMVKGLSMPTKGAIKLIATAEKLMVSWNAMNLQIEL